MKQNIIPHKHTVSFQDRCESLGQSPKLLWFTGLSGSGKSTLANALEGKLHREGFKTYLLDGDNVRSGLNSDLDFSDQGRKENIRRIAEVSRLFIDAGVIVLTAFISPFRRERKLAEDLVGAENFIEVFVDCPLEVCEQRDVKGLYAKARKGEIKDFTGINSPYEAPENPSVTVNTHLDSLDTCSEKLMDFIKSQISYPNNQ